MTLRGAFLFFLTFQKNRELRSTISEHELFQQEKFKVRSFIAY